MAALPVARRLTGGIVALAAVVSYDGDMTKQDADVDTAHGPRGEHMSALVALVVEVFRSTGSWRAVRVLVEDGARRHCTRSALTWP